MLHYYRCDDCLSSMTYAEGDLDAVCACGGTLEYLGIVHEDNSVSLKLEVPICDGCCTGAKGNSCRCQCSGKNHGTALTVIIEYHNGQAIVTPCDARAIERATEYRTAYQAIHDALSARYGEMLSDYRTGRWIADKEIWSAIHWTLQDLNKVREIRTHNGRMKKITKLAAQIAA